MVIQEEQQREKSVSVKAFTHNEIEWYLENANFTEYGIAPENQVFRLLCKGMSIIEISLKLFCSERTIITRKKSIMQKIIKCCGKCAKALFV